MIESVFRIESLRQRHRMAPCLTEREKYLTYLLEIGTRRERVRNIASMLLHVVRLLKMDSCRPVRMDEIAAGTKHWVEEANRHRRPGMACEYTFHIAATNWLRFQGALVLDDRPALLFGDLLSEFEKAMYSQRAMVPDTIEVYRLMISAFLNWLESRCPRFSSVQPSDIEEFLKVKRSDGYSIAYTAKYCSVLRAFFRCAEERQWCARGIRESIPVPRVPRVTGKAVGPPWEDVRRLIASIGNLTANDLRAKAMILLLSIYGFRSAEVRGLTLDDVDWRKDLITVNRAKRGRIQQIPLQQEVGEAIAEYLEKARPGCSCRNLFVTLKPPYRPLMGHSMYGIVAPRARKLGLRPDRFAPHMLRRACATRLLKLEFSLKEIADFLGHRDLRSVGKYATFDFASLQKVAKFSLRGVL